MAGVKKFLMTFIWRIQQSQMLIGVLFWSLTLTGVFYQYFSPIFEDILGISQENVLVGMTVLFFLVLGSVVLIGFAYDRIFKIWREYWVVAVERNPYSRVLLTPQQILLWKRCEMRILKEVAGDDPKTLKDIEFMDKWMDKLLEDPAIQRQVEETEKIIMS
jgi:hypothetical protein